MMPPLPQSVPDDDVARAAAELLNRDDVRLEYQRCWTFNSLIRNTDDVFAKAMDEPAGAETALAAILVKLKLLGIEIVPSELETFSNDEISPEGQQVVTVH